MVKTYRIFRNTWITVTIQLDYGNNQVLVESILGSPTYFYGVVDRAELTA